MSSDLSITVSIVSHGNTNTISTLLESMQKHETDLRRFQIILTDNLENNLPDFDPVPWGSLQMIRNTTPLGFARNHNKAFKSSRSKWFAILNPDLIFEHSVFDQLLERLKAIPNTILAPQIVDDKGKIQDSFRTMPTPFEIIRRRLPGYKFEAYQPDIEGLIHPDWMAGMFWLMDSEVYRQLGGMDERYQLYFEDVDFCTRARLVGIKVLGDSRVQIRHDAQRSSRRKFYYLLLHSQSALRFFTSPVYRQARSGSRYSS